MQVYQSKTLIPGVNDVKSLYPDLATEWDEKRNKELGLDIKKITQGSGKRAYWKCSKCGHEYMAIVANRTHGSGCPECAKKKPHANKPEVSLFALRPEVARYYSSENEKRSDQVPVSSNLIVKWECPDCGYRWENRISRQARSKEGCPKCYEDKIRSIGIDINLDPEKEYYRQYPVNALLYLLGKEQMDIMSSKDLSKLAGEIGNEKMAVLNYRANGLTLRATGEEIGLSYERVRQIENDLKKKYSVQKYVLDKN